MRMPLAAISKKAARVGWSFWLTMLLVAVGWGPLFIADLVRANANSRLDASYLLQHYALLWMPITKLCSLLAAFAGVVGVVQFFLGRAPTSQRRQ
jgi:hypothetical protein